MRKKKKKQSKHDRDKDEQANNAQSQATASARVATKTTTVHPLPAEFALASPHRTKSKIVAFKSRFSARHARVRQKGHPSRYCQMGKAGRANQADEDNKSIASTPQAQHHSEALRGAR